MDELSADMDGMVSKYRQYNHKYVGPNSITRGVRELRGVAGYMINWFFVDSIIIKDGILSFNARQTDYLIMTKTPETQKYENIWKKEVEKYLKDDKSRKQGSY